MKSFLMWLCTVAVIATISGLLMWHNFTEYAWHGWIMASGIGFLIIGVVTIFWIGAKTNLFYDGGLTATVGVLILIAFFFVVRGSAGLWVSLHEQEDHWVVIARGSSDPKDAASQYLIVRLEGSSRIRLYQMASWVVTDFPPIGTRVSVPHPPCSFMELRRTIVLFLMVRITLTNSHQKRFNVRAYRVV